MTNKRNKHLLVALPFLLMALLTVCVSCSSRQKETELIPQDVDAVACVNIQQLWQKGDLDDMNNLAFVKLFRQELNEENPQMGKLMNAVLDNPSQSGISLKTNVIAFAHNLTNDNVNNAYIVVSALLSDHKKFASFLQELADK